MAVTMTACDLSPTDPGNVPSVVAVVPRDGATGVLRQAPIEILFDRPMAARAVQRATVRLESGPSRPFLTVRYDPIDRRVIAARFSGGPLEPNVQYRVELEPIPSLDGVFSDPFTSRFQTGPDVGPVYREQTATYDEVQPILSRCATSSCHGAEAPALGLDLSSGEAIARTAINIPAIQTGGRDFVGDRGLMGFPIVDVLADGGRPGTSYLLYKMIGDERVPGHGGESSREDAEWVSRWILAGAPTE